MILTDTDLAATNPAFPALPALPAIDPAMGQRAPQRVRLVAPVTAPLAVTIPTQDASWRACAMQLAFDHDATCAAMYLGHSARGSESYTVRASLRSRLTFRVSFLPNAGAVTLDDGRWLCACADGRAGRPCFHVGAAALLANRRAIRRESVLAARYERMSAAHATLEAVNPQERVAYYRVGHARGSRWNHLRIVWDTANDVALWCDCGASGPCAHVGAVALRCDQERADRLFAAQHARQHARHSH